MRPLLYLGLGLAALGVQAPDNRDVPTAFRTGADALAVLSFPAADKCSEESAPRVAAAGVWVDGRYEHELLLFPSSGRDRYDTLLGPFGPGQHEVELRQSALWPGSPCVQRGRAAVAVVEAGSSEHALLAHAPVLEVRADTVGEQTDVPLYEYVEALRTDASPRPGAQDGPGLLKYRYTVVFSNEDGGTATRSLLARWGRTTDIEQVYEVAFEGGRVVREEFQGPDHEIRIFKGRRRGAAPVLLVATLNNMVTDRGRGVARVRPVPQRVDLSSATRESSLDSRPWACRVMARELEAEGRIAAKAPMGDRWLRQAPDPRHHVYFEARLTLDRALAAAWVRDARGQLYRSDYGRDSLAIERSEWVRSAVAVGPDPASAIADLGWTCLPLPGQQRSGQPAGGSCTIEATRAFAFGDGWLPGANLVVPATFTLKAGEEGRLSRR